MKARFKKYLPAILLSGLLIFVWEIYARSGAISKTILPAPSNVVYSLYDFREVILKHTMQTLGETMIGLGLAILLGVFLALIVFYSPRLRNAIYPLLIVSQTIPLIALAPLLLIWFGFGIMPKVLIVLLFCFFPITISLIDSLMSTPKQYVDYVTSLGASKRQILMHVYAPHSLEGFFAGLKISATYAVTGAIVGEYVGAYKGLGVFMQQAASSHAINLVFAAILVIILITMFLFALVFWLQRIMMPWKKNEIN